MAVLLLLLVTSLCVEVCHSQAAQFQWGPDLYFRNHWPHRVSTADLQKYVFLNTCAALCSTKPWCSSFFYRSQNKHCLLFRRVYVDRQLLKQHDGIDYYRIASDKCPIDKCYYLSRPDNMCFHLDLSQQKATYDDSKAFCEGNHGRLAILDTRRKNFWIVELLKMHNALSGARLYLGARLDGTDYKWSNGTTVAGSASNENFWIVPGQVSSPSTPCLVLETGQADGTSWRYSACNTKSAQILCEYQMTN